MVIDACIWWVFMLEGILSVFDLTSSLFKLLLAVKLYAVQGSLGQR